MGWGEWEMRHGVMGNWLSSDLITLMAPTEPRGRFGPGFQKIAALTIQPKPVSVHLWEYGRVTPEVMAQLCQSQSGSWLKLTLKALERRSTGVVVISRCQPNTAGFLQLWRRLLIAQLSTRWSWPNFRGCLTRKTADIYVLDYAEGWYCMHPREERQANPCLSTYMYFSLSFLSLSCCYYYYSAESHSWMNIQNITAYIVGPDCSINFS